MIFIYQGCEYRGETYIVCVDCAGTKYPCRDEPGVFEGESLAELKAFIAEHEHKLFTCYSGAC